VEVIKIITDNRNLCDASWFSAISIFRKSERRLTKNAGLMTLFNVTTELESNLIGGFIGCDLDQANVVPDGIFLDLVFMNVEGYLFVGFCWIKLMTYLHKTRVEMQLVYL
jgi:hypothetical protein